MIEMPTTLLMSRYRSFKNAQALPLKPITLIYGRNNAGKSAAVRALPLLESGVLPDRRMAVEAFSATGARIPYEELVWKGEAGDYTLNLGLRWANGPFVEAEFTLDRGAGQAPFVRELVLRDTESTTLWSGYSDPHGTMRPEKPFAGAAFQFEGLVPQQPDSPLLSLLAERMKALRGRVSWLRASRRLGDPERLVQGSPPLRLQSDGSNALEFLIEDDALLRQVSAFYAGLSPSRVLDKQALSAAGNRYRLVLNPRFRPEWSLPLESAGEGMTQVLPVLVAAQLAADSAPAVLVIEEADNGLHPDAQEGLIRHLCSLAAGENPPTFLLETHSRIMLLGVQLAVAEGRLPADRVRLVWVDQHESSASMLTPIELTAEGFPSAGWPPGALEEDTDLASRFMRFAIGGGAEPR
jgi:hypothetical protein